MKERTSKILKIVKFVLIHLFEIAVIAAVSWWVFNYAPEQYQWPVVILFVVMYVIYFANEVIDEYKEYKGADFMV